MARAFFSIALEIGRGGPAVQRDCRMSFPQSCEVNDFEIFSTEQKNHEVEQMT